MTTNLNDPLLIASNARGFIAGQTRSGKTELAKVLTDDEKRIPRLFIIDAKHTWDADRRFVTVEDIADIPRISEAAWNPEAEIRNEVPKGISAVVWRPQIEVLENMEEQNRVWQWIYKTRNMFVQVDELLSCVKSAMSYPLSMKACYVQGGQLGIGILGCSQRPSGIPTFCMESAGQYWKFFMAHRGDQERMAEYMGEIVVEPKNLPARSPFGETRRQKAHIDKHSFYYYWQGQEGQPRQYILDLENDNVEMVNNGKLRDSVAPKYK